MNCKKNNLPENREWDLVFLPLVFLFAFIFAFNNIFEADTLWHLKLGQYILSTHSFPYHDIFSYTLAGTKIYPVEWLFEVVWFIIYRLFGVAGLVIIKAIVTGGSAVLLYLSFQNYRINRYVSLAIIAGIFITAGSYFVDRPQLITYLCLAMFVFITSLPGMENKRFLWLMPFVMLVWVNAHPGAVFGILFLFAWLMEGFLSLLKQDIKPGLFHERLIIFFIACLVTLITPSTYHLYTFLFHHVTSLGSKSGLEYVTEFMPPSLSQSPAMFAGLVVFTVILIAGLFRMPLRYVLFGLVMIPLSFDMRRMVIMALIGVACGAGITVDRWLSWIRNMKKGYLFLIPVYAACLILPFSYEVYQWKNDYVGYKGVGIQRQFYPDRAINFILEHHMKGNIYNAINFGGAVIFLGYPDIKDFIDTRLEPERLLFSKVNDAMDNPAEFDDLMQKYDVAYALVETYVPRNYGRLFPAPAWKLVYFDDYAQIYVKSGTGNDGIIKDYAYDVFDPYSFLYSTAPLFSPDAYFTQPGLIEELQNLVREVPYSAMAHLEYGIALIYNNADYNNGLKQIDSARRIMRYNPRILLWYGIEHGLNGDTGRMKKSFNMLNTVLEYQEGATVKNKAFMNYVMGYYYYLAGMNDQAKKSLKRALQFDPKLSDARTLLDHIQ